MQEEKYGFEITHPTDLNVVYDVHEDERDKDFAGIVALLPQAKPQRIKSAKAGSRQQASSMMHSQAKKGARGKNSNSRNERAKLC